MNITIRGLQGEAMLEALFPLTQYAFHPSPPFENKEEWYARIRERQGLSCRAVFEDETPVSIAVSSTMTQNMRGALYPASGVWGVASHPTARRKGYVRQAMASLLAVERENGKAFSNLWPFRESFYERLGYVSFPLMKIARFSPQALASLTKRDLEGEIELKLMGEAYETYRQYLAAKMRLTHGMTTFDFGDQAMANRNRSWAAFARFNGEIEGVMLYSLQGEEVTKFNFSATRFYYQTARARYLLLSWIARHIDQADRAEIWLPGDEIPESWLVDLQLKSESTIRAAMSRVLDVVKIGGMQVGDGNFTAQINDPLCPWNEGVWRFEGCDGRLLVSEASGAECEFTIQGLTALIAGTHDPEDFALRGWGNPGAETRAVLRNMFPRLYPYLHENF